MTFETAFTMDTSRIKYGPGATREVGQEYRSTGCWYASPATYYQTFTAACQRRGF